MSKQQAWSYSALGAFETCPWRYYETKITKRIVEPQTDETMWGNRVHKALELRVGTGSALPHELAAFEPVAAKLVEAGRDGRVGVEMKLALNRDFQSRKFFDKDVWVRGVADVTIEKRDRLFVGDYKTGKKKPDSQQLALTAAMMFSVKPWINTIVNAFIWLKSDEITKETFQREDAPAIWNEFIPRVNRLQEAIDQNVFPKRPSGLCKKYCPVNTCEHNGAYRGGR